MLSIITATPSTVWPSIRAGCKRVAAVRVENKGEVSFCRSFSVRIDPRIMRLVNNGLKAGRPLLADTMARAAPSAPRPLSVDTLQHTQRVRNTFKQHCTFLTYKLCYNIEHSQTVCAL